MQIDYTFPISVNGSLTLQLREAKISQTLKYAILCFMQTSNANWTKWAEILSHFHMRGLVGWLLEAGEPLALVGAQLLYFGQPFIGNDKVEEMATLLENQEETRAFAAFLRKE